MNTTYKAFACCLLFYLFNFSIFGQQSFDSSYIKAVSVYTNFISHNAHLYNGSAYIDYDHRIVGNPYFLAPYFTGGSIVYDGVLYTNIDMFYDILHDELIIKNYNDTALLLVKEKISSFNLLEHSFINSSSDNNIAKTKAAGFFDVLYNGNIKLVAKRSKIIFEKTVLQDIESSFIENDKYYILKNDVLYVVRDKNSVLDVLKEKKNDLRKLLHQSKVKYRKDPEAAMIKMVAYYDSLNNAK